MKLDVRVDELGHLTFVPVRTRRTLTRLVFLEGGLSVAARKCSPVLLRWDDFERTHADGERRLDEVQWTVEHWGAGKSGIYGVAIRCGAAHEASLAELVQRTRTVWRRFSTMGSARSGILLPVLPRENIVVPHLREMATLRALSDVLCNYGNLRTRLDDPERVKRLANDLRAGWLGQPVARIGVGQDRVDVRTALRQGGFVHPFGRPLTNTELPTVEQVAIRVEELLRANPYRADRTNDRAQIERIVRREYTDVKPWPFAALVDD